ncbi:MAG: hypothetical protein JO199_04000 [Candidatus Eremiobacteraeota bacterium]|nr:hypothetical protein [Candidatus Eremiobacteraeota bacterium]
MKLTNIERRAFLAALASAGTYAACSPTPSGLLLPTSGASSPHRHAKTAPPSFSVPAWSTSKLTIVNKSSADTIYWGMWGLDWNPTITDRAWWYVAETGGTYTVVKTQAGPGAKTAPYLSVDMFHTLSGPQTTVTFPVLQSGECFISIGQPLECAVANKDGLGSAVTVLANPFPAPNSRDYLTRFGQFEFTIDPGSGAYPANCNPKGVNLPCDGILYPDLSNVDQISLPLTLEVNVNGNVSSAGFVPGGYDEFFAALAATPPFDRLIIYDGTTPVRALAPQHGIELGLFPADYLDTYIERVWEYLIDHPVTFFYPAGNPGTGRWNQGLAKAQVKSGVLTFSPVINKTYTSTFTPFQMVRPTTYNVFACSGPFIGGGNTRAAAILAIFVSALNRTCVTTGSGLPTGANPKTGLQPGCDPDLYYQNQQTNYFSKYLHQTAIGGLAYGFPFDDDCQQSSTLAGGSGATLKVIITN